MNDTKPRKAQFEAMILEPVLEAAEARARQQDRQLPQVAKAILIRASEDATPLLDEDGKPTEPAHPAERPAAATRRRIRFRVDAAAHEIVKDRIRASGTSMTAALEQGLLNYARTGEY